MRADELSKAFEKELSEYLETSIDIVRNTVDEVVEVGVSKLKITSPKKSGRYSRGWKAKTTLDSSTGKTSTLHNTKGQLTHLLEKGYAKVNGGRVAGFPHIAPVEAELMDKFEKTLKERL